MKHEQVIKTIDKLCEIQGSMNKQTIINNCIDVEKSINAARELRALSRSIRNEARNTRMAAIQARESAA